MRTCRELGIDTVAVYCDPDAAALHVRLADRSVRIGPAPASESYLRAEAIVAAAIETGADAIHPGYGFLSEQAPFAEAVEAAGIAFVGPTPRTLASLGDKLAARRSARDVGVPIVPGVFEPLPADDPAAVDEIVAIADRIGFPVLVKAAAGGGGRGMRRVDVANELPAALAAASHEARIAFGDGSVYLERLVEGGRHIEVQLLGDTAGRDRRARGARLLDPAPAPEARRGSAGSRADRGAAAAAPRARGADRRVRRAAQRRDRRVPLRARWRVLLPRGQRAPPGRAWRHRARDGSRPRPRAAPHRCGRAPVRSRQARGRAGRDADEPRDRAARQRRGPVGRFRAGTRERSPAGASRAARACAWTPASSRAGTSAATTTRCSRSSSSMPRTATRRSRRRSARSPSSRPAACRRPSRSTPGCSTCRPSPAVRCGSTSSRGSGIPRSCGAPPRSRRSRRSRAPSPTWAR